ncbi:DUF3685 domain-containing protein [Alkalinema sp. FACHB-956]|uniref:DUF3685 domain-containing protein n=1 Tax=Alkalinema sp. FACHB-956 TaxID=2692768 RepID=UPI001688F50F|nr:DUF3685 domain-containing protein [Alkalinema sp. FACHB-956]MBD2325303.1 DUF3685 domain-containing protein [Alkalinema sp. FACHB-956]
MNASFAELTAPVICMVVEADSAMRRELSFYLQQHPWQIVAEVTTTDLAWERFMTLRDTPQAIQWVVLGVPLTGRGYGDRSGLALCQALKAINPTIKIILLADLRDPALFEARQLGVEGCFARDTPIESLISGFTQILQGETVWSADLPLPTDQRGFILPGNQPRSQLPGTSGQSFGQSSGQSIPLAGIQQIDTLLLQLERQLRTRALSWVDRLVLQGRCRELRAARWILAQLASQSSPSPKLPASTRPTESLSPPSLPSMSPSSSQWRASQPSWPSADSPFTSSPFTKSGLVSQPLAMPPKKVQDLLFERLASKLRWELKNVSSIPLEMDILRLDRKQELLYVVLRKVETLLAELTLAQVDPPQLTAKQAELLTDLWEASTIDFLGKYYTLRDSIQTIEVVPAVLHSYPIVQRDILSKIPLVPDLFAYLLFQTPLIQEFTLTSPGAAPVSSEQLDRAAAILENLVIQIANAVIQPILNQFADWEPIKQNFYDRRHMTSREIERFRNDLSWRYRRDRWFDTPTHIFESQYRLWTLSDRGIRRIAIYSPRRQELETLSGIPLAVTIALEARDALSPRLRAAFSILGAGVVYLLTEVVGRGLGLIGRGIAKGIGDAWQDRRS